MTKVSIYGAVANKNNFFDIIFIPLENPEEMPASPVENGLVNPTDQTALDTALLGIEDDIKAELYESNSKYYMDKNTLDLGSILMNYKDKYEGLGFEFSLIYARKSTINKYITSDDDIIYTDDSNRINVGTQESPKYVKTNFKLKSSDTQYRINTGTSGDSGIKVAFKRLYVPSELNIKLREIKEQKDTYLIPENIKNDVTILGVTGTYDGAILPYGRMLDNLDNINNTQISLRQDLSAITFVGDISGYSTTSGESYPITECKIDSHSSMAVLANQGDVATAIGLTTNKIKLGETILGITGTYSDAMKSYNSETAMNNDIDNISEGEVVKVVVTSGIAGDVDNPLTTTITHYIKETTMKKLVKEVDIS